MEQLEIEDDNRRSKPSVKQKIVTFYNNHKFPLTVEPLVFFYSLSYGLNEVLGQQKLWTKFHNGTIAGDKSQFTDREDLSEQAKLLGGGVCQPHPE